jgi:hypothetical protein
MTASPNALEIRLVNESPTESATRDHLLGILDTYPLDKWRYTDIVQIEDGVIPHSHPVLTLSGWHDPLHPLRLLSSYIHEQLHWFWLLAQHGNRPLNAMEHFETLFPNLPVGPPQGCRSEFSNYLHVAINYLELLACAELFGMEQARDFIARKPYYTAIYALVLAEADGIHAILAEPDLIPPLMPPANREFITVNV